MAAYRDSGPDSRRDSIRLVAVTTSPLASASHSASVRTLCPRWNPASHNKVTNASMAALWLVLGLPVATLYLAVLMTVHWFAAPRR